MNATLTAVGFSLPEFVASTEIAEGLIACTTIHHSAGSPMVAYSTGDLGRKHEFKTQRNAIVKHPLAFTTRFFVCR